MVVKRRLSWNGLASPGFDVLMVGICGDLWYLVESPRDWHRWFLQRMALCQNGIQKSVLQLEAKAFMSVNISYYCWYSLFGWCFHLLYVFFSKPFWERFHSQNDLFMFGKALKASRHEAPLCVVRLLEPRNPSSSCSRPFSLKRSPIGWKDFWGSEDQERWTRSHWLGVFLGFWCT